MKILKPFAWLICLTVIFSGCAGPKSLERKINRTAYEPVFFYESEKVTEKADKTVSFELVNMSELPAHSTVVKNKGRMLWLLFYQKYNYDMTIMLGQNASEPGALNLIQHAITSTFDRSGTFKTAIPVNNSAADYRSVVTVKEADVTCNFFTEGFAFWGVSDYAVNAENSVGKLVFNLKLYDKGGSLLLDRNYTEEQSMKYNSSSVKLHDVKRMAMKNLIENLTVSSQNIAAEMTKNINDILEISTISSTASKL